LSLTSRELEAIEKALSWAEQTRQGDYVSEGRFADLLQVVVDGADAREVVESGVFTNDAGRPFWGNQGAGLLVICKGTGHILLPLRSANVNEPGTYGVWGGKIDADEDPIRAAKREFREESGYSGPMHLVRAHVFKTDGFSYHNFVAFVPSEFVPRLGWETESAEWVSLDGFLEKSERFHFGLRELWHHSGALIRRAARPALTARAGPSS
jgi:8-oxo-dGTP pyrophosphatase MutT (NUDIX family)